MSTRLAPLLLAAGAILAAGAAPPPPDAPQQNLIDAATHTVRSLHAQIGRGFAPLLRLATAALIAPHGNGGGAVLLLHARDGWSEPAFFSATALPGRTQTVVLIMNEQALYAILHQRGLVLAGAGAMTLKPLVAGASADLLLWPGKMARIDPDGFFQDDAADAAWYGRQRDAPDILGFTAPDLRSSGLRGALGR